MAKAQKQELAVIDFTQFSVAQLPELKGKKEEIASIIEANPIVEIVDNATYESAKKSRTAVKTLRTGLEKEQKDVKKKIKEHVLDVVDSEYDILILGVKASEQSRQEPIDVWEEKKEQERQEKVRLEQERIDGIKAKINEFKQNWESKIFELVFNNCQSLKEDLAITENEFDRVSLAEFDILFDREVSYLKDLLNSKIQTLTEQEQIRIDNLLIQEKNAEQSRIQEWQRVWNANIDSLSFSDIADVKSVLVKSKLADLKHYVSGYEEIYLSAEKRLHSQIEFVSKAEEQRIAQEQFEKKQKEFDEKQLEVRYKSRCLNLKELNIDLDSLLSVLGVSKHSLFLNALKNFPDSAFEVELKELLDFIKSKTPIEEVEVVAEEVVELPSLETKTQEVEFEPISFDLPKAETWDSIQEDFEIEKNNSPEYGITQEHFEMKSLIFNWFEENYNVPTRKL